MSNDLCACGAIHARPTGLATPGRRQLIAMAAGSLAVLSGGRAAFAASETKAPPKPENVLSPDAALAELMEGNHRYVKGYTRRHDFATERAALSRGQNPFAAIVSCADSRVGVEFAFDSRRGDLFGTRVAGNFVNDDSIASLEYGVAVLGVPLIMVLGHGACGAVASTIKSIDTNTTLPGHLPSLVKAITPAVEAARKQPGDLLVNATKENVRQNVERLKQAGPILSAAVADKKLLIVGGYYELTNGAVVTV